MVLIINKNIKKEIFMCFSAAASFTASSVLALIGIMALLKTQGNRRLLPAASIPLIFGIQQAAALCYICLRKK
jgi:hypothetical protein